MNHKGKIELKEGKQRPDGGWQKKTSFWVMGGGGGMV